MLVPNMLLQNRYRIARQLGHGGMGAVYLATDQRFNKTVAIKQAFLVSDNLTRAFEREARLLNDLRHPALPVVIDFFFESDGWFLVMDYVPGEDLGEAMAKSGQAFDPGIVLRWADQLLDALEYLHGFDPPIIHRDIKPQNLKVTAKGDLMVLDFGLAKGSAAEMSQTTDGKSVHGYTPHYAPIEQIRGTGTDVRSDLYAVAATLYHLMTGQRPLDALERAMAQLNGQPDPLRLPNELNPAIAPDVAEVLYRSMATNANQRPASAHAMRNALRNASGLEIAKRAGRPAGIASSAPPPPATQPVEAIDTGGRGVDSKAETEIAGASTQPEALKRDRLDPAYPPTVAERTVPVRHDSVPPAKSKRNMVFVLAALALLFVTGATAVMLATDWPFKLFSRPGTGGPTTAPDSSRAALPPLEVVKFDIVEVDAEGRVTKPQYGVGMNKSFVEELPNGVTMRLMLVEPGKFDMGSPRQTGRLVEPEMLPVAYAAQEGPFPGGGAGPRNRPRIRDRIRDTEPESPRSTPEHPQPEPRDSGDSTEYPRHEVTLSEYFIGQTEVTQAQWRAVASLPKVNRTLNPNPSEFKGDDLPVENVGWEDAVEFCLRLHKYTKLDYRLPSEAEWEYACRAGTSTPFGFGMTLTPQIAMFDYSSLPMRPVAQTARGTVSVGIFGKANNWGLYDMHGNVGEWCQDVWFDDHAGAPADGTARTSGGDSTYRVVRGGSWLNPVEECRSASRHRIRVDDPRAVGFRVVVVR